MRYAQKNMRILLFAGVILALIGVRLAMIGRELEGMVLFASGLLVAVIGHAALKIHMRLRLRNIGR